MKPFENYERPLITSGSNDDADAKDHIKQVVMAAKTSVEIFDDGDKIKEGESVYDDREFLELVDEKLDEGVRFLCLFNSDNTSDHLHTICIVLIGFTLKTLSKKHTSVPEMAP